MVQQLERIDEEPPQETAESVQRRREASEALRRASGWFTGVSWMYRGGAIAYGLATIFAIFALARNEVPVGGGVLVVALTTLLTVLNLMGAMHLHFRPFVWNIVIASLATGVVIVHAVGPNPMGLALPANLVFATILWCALVPTHQFQTLITQHKDLYILHHAGANTRRSLRGKSPEEKHRRLVDAMRRASIRTWEYSGAAAVAIVAISAAGTYFIVNNTRPQQIEETLERFEAAWNRSDVDDVGAFYDGRIREQETRWLAGRTAGLGWDRELPGLGESTRNVEADGRTHVDYETAAAPIQTEWFLDGTRWTLAKIELPIPEFDPVLEEFLGVWAESDQDRIADFFPAQDRAEMLQSIKSSIESLEWPRLPEVVETLVSETDDGEKFVTLVFEKRRVRTRWHLRGGGDWRMHYMKFPKR